LRREIRPLLEETVRSSRFVARGVFDQAYIARLVEEHVEGKQDHNFRLWILLNLEVWHRLFIDGESREETLAWVEGPAHRPRISADVLAAT
jgi:asparagine synthase (glutamine-hydrolysing)